MNIDLPLIFAILMGVAVLAYVVLDGYDLGVGMLMPAGSDEEQNLMVASIGPFWDANETWLVLGVGLLIVAFPRAHGIILGALYLPVAAMLIGLMLRGVAFEFRVKARGWHRDLWNALFWFGSFLASLAQGLMLGRYITGFESGVGYWLFSLTVAGALCGGYVLLGASWLVMRTEGALQQKAIGWSRWGLGWVALGVVLISIVTPMASATVMHKWIEFPRIIALMPLPLATLAAGIWAWRSLGRLRGNAGGADWTPFAASILIFFFSFLGLAYSLFPFVIMDQMTIWEAAAHESSLTVVLAGALVVLPFIVAYTIVSYRVFSGKTHKPVDD